MIKNIQFLIIQMLIIILILENQLMQIELRTKLLKLLNKKQHIKNLNKKEMEARDNANISLILPHSKSTDPIASKEIEDKPNSRIKTKHKKAISKEIHTSSTKKVKGMQIGNNRSQEKMQKESKSIKHRKKANNNFEIITKKVEDVDSNNPHQLSTKASTKLRTSRAIKEIKDLGSSEISYEINVNKEMKSQLSSKRLKNSKENSLNK